MLETNSAACSGTDKQTQITDSCHMSNKEFDYGSDDKAV